MIANYHTHTWRCRHATESEERYVQNAVQRGLQILGFSDHTPYLFPGEGDYYSYFRMYPEELDEHIDTVLSLKKSIKILYKFILVSRLSFTLSTLKHF